MSAKAIDWTVPGILGALGVILWLMAAGAFAFYSYLSGTVERVEAWPTTEALVLVNHWETYQGKNPNSGKIEQMPILKLEYSYEVDGKSYTGKKANVDRTGGRFVDTDYPVGSRMPVRYDPTDPSIVGVKMDIENEMSLHWFIYLIGALTALGAVFVGFAARSWLRQRASQA